MLLSLLACTDAGDGEKPDGHDSAPPLSTPGPCADGSWMGEDGAAGLIFVAPGSSPGGDGSYEHPYADLPRAVLAAEDQGSATVALYPGSHAFGHAVHVAEGRRIVVTGCPGETEIVGGGRQAGFAMEGAGEAVLRNVTVRGGAPGVAVRGGVEGLVEDVTIVSALRVGLQVAGPTTRATVRRLAVERVYAGGRAAPRGWGVSLADGSLVLLDSTVTGVYGYGVYAERGELVVRDSTIDGQKAMWVGGLYAHAMTAVTLDGVSVRSVMGEGVQLYEVGAASLTSVSVNDVAASPYRGLGDGIVVRKGAHPVATTTITDTVVTGAARLGVAVDGGTLTLDAVSASGGVMDGGASLWATAATSVTGSASALDLAAHPLGADGHPGEGPEGFERRGR